MSIEIAAQYDIPELVNLMDSAYRGDASKQGWTSEADLFTGNQRTDEATVFSLMQKTDAVFLKYLNNKKQLEGCVFLHKKGSHLYLGMFSVLPSAQGKGIGKKLLEAADKHARKLHCHSIYMTVISVRKELIAWYERHGYRHTGRVVPFPVEERFGIPIQPLEMLVLEKLLP